MVVVVIGGGWWWFWWCKDARDVLGCALVGGWGDAMREQKMSKKQDEGKISVGA